MSLFRKPNVNLSPRQLLLNRFNVARHNILIVIIATLINIVLALFGDGTYFLFSASVPHYLVLDAMYLCGMLSESWYEGSKSEYFFFDISYLVIMVAFAVLILAVYFLFWLLSKNQKRGWMIATLVFFAIDTLGMFYLWGVNADMFLNLIFHIYIICFIISGLIAASKLQKIPPDESEENAEKEGIDYYAENVDLGKGKTANNVSANCMRAKEAIGGKLYFYNDRIIFKSHAINVYAGDTTILYADMVKTAPKKYLGINNRILIYTNDGTEHEFVINRRDYVMSYIDKKILTARAQAM